MARIDLVVHGRGRGHASRALACASALREVGHELALYAGGDAEPVLRDSGAFNPLPIVRPGLAAPAGWLRRLTSDARRFERAADCLISDGDHPSLVLARRRALPSVAVDHGLALTHGALPIRPPPLLRLHERLNNAPLALATRRVAVHFLPFSPRDPDLRCARPDLRPELRRDTSEGGFLLAYFRDDNGLRALSLARDAGAELVCFGARDPQLPGVRFLPQDRDAFAAHLLRCDGVLASAGSNVLAECVMLGKPLLALHHRGDAEQALNAGLAEHAGVALGRPFDALSRADLDLFLARARARDFARVDLERALPPVSQVVVDLVAELV